MLIVLPKISARIATAGSPAPRKTALIRKRRKTEAFPPIITRANGVPTATTSGVAPINASSCGA
ncbi:hypothetical protein D3C83_227940 [compost metagenome]